MNIYQLMEQSSLGTPGAKELRKRPLTHLLDKVQRSAAAAIEGSDPLVSLSEDFTAGLDAFPQGARSSVGGTRHPIDVQVPAASFHIEEVEDQSSEGSAAATPVARRGSGYSQAWKGGRVGSRVSVVIPTYNEAQNLPHVLSLLPEDLHEVIVVDGHSIDGTTEVARALRPDVRIVLQARSGRGNGMACGFAAATGDIIVMLDSDGSADPREIPRFVAALRSGADYVSGSRFLDEGGSEEITRTRLWGYRWLNRVTNLLFGTRYTDVCYHYNAFWADCLGFLELSDGADKSDGKVWGDGFELDAIISTRVAKAGLRIAEVPSFEFRRVHGRSNLNTWRDGSRMLRAILIEWVNGRGKVRQPYHVWSPRWVAATEPADASAYRERFNESRAHDRIHA